MGLQDVYEVWDAWEYNQVDMLYSLIRLIKDDIEPVLDVLSGNITFGLDNIGLDLEGILDDIKPAITDMINTLKGALDEVFTHIVKPVWEEIKVVGSQLVTVYERISSSIVGATAVISTELGAMSDSIGRWIKDEITTLWGWVKTIPGQVYQSLKDALDWCWEKFVKVVIPFIYDMLVKVYESPEVQRVIEFITKQLKALLDWLFEIDDAEMEKWAKKTATFIKALVESEGAA